ncbi:MAG: anti-sigma regulatory factor [Hamadaea sp.]|nr:anti-sigma regulatory factor [Hamadaea sp.]
MAATDRFDEATVDHDVVTLVVPADGGYLGVLRTATAGLAARLHYTLERIEDLRIAVDEACAMLLVITPPDAELRCRFEIGPQQLSISISAPVKDGARLPSPTSWPWHVLTSLTAQATAELTANEATIRMVSQRLAGR